MPEYINNTAYIAIPTGIDLFATFECGQAFRWKATEQGQYDGVAGGMKVRISRTEAGISISPCTPEQYEGFWRHYLDLDADYAAFAEILGKDEVLAPMVGPCAGMRILNQPIWECLISFILSSNNNVRRISGIVERLCARYGKDMGGFYAFPTPEHLHGAGQAGAVLCGAGYRADYVHAAAKAVCEGFDIEALPKMGYAEAKKALIQLPGVGEKVADCVLLYSCGYREAFPVDVWVLRAMQNHYPEAGKNVKELRRFAAERFGELAGVAQQVLFYYERCLIHC